MTGRRKRAKRRGRVAPLRRAVDARLAAWRSRVDALVAGGMDRRLAVGRVNAEDILAQAKQRQAQAPGKPRGVKASVVENSTQETEPTKTRDEVAKLAGVSVRHLRTACPGAPASFLVEMLEQGRTIAEAAALWRARRVAAEIEAERAARLAAERELATVKVPVKATAPRAPRAPRNRYWF